ncbi:MAG: 30S ribosomal protein S20 [Proteobacteria bacterium]|nr:30S ribosomal protein S20 [Pseudomonadota bacterium]
MGRHASAIKRARQNEKRRLINKTRLSKMRTALKAARAGATPEDLKRTSPIIMKGAQRGVIHRRKASRLVSRLARHVNAQGA